MDLLMLAVLIGGGAFVLWAFVSLFHQQSDLDPHQPVSYQRMVKRWRSRTTRSARRW